MRILAIRGENLASLRKFDLDLSDADGLGAVGLFAITGPTGAGKSTLLDALCLALYDNMPRFDSKHRSHKVGRDPEDPTNLVATDVRNILRRGAGEGHAEVDFVGRDGGHYRARWTVRRAHRRPGNRMQAQSMTLHDLLDDRDLSGATKSETLKAIEHLTGLSFDQFRRSVLLAQGDFDAFLRARVKDRGALLEAMTGTEIYGRISKAAHARKREAYARLQRIDDRLQAYVVLAAGPRARLETQVAAGEAWTKAASVVEARAQAGVRWHERHTALAAAVAAAKASHAAARRADADEDDARALLDRVRQAQPIAPRVEAAARADAEVTRRAARVASTRQAAEEAAGAAKVSAQTAKTARRALDEARAREDAVAPDVQAARALDAQVTAAIAARDETQAEVARAQASLDARTTTLARLTAARADARAAADAARETLTSDAGLSSLIPRWETLSAGARRWQEATARRAESQAAVEAAQAQTQARAAALSDAQASRAAAQAALRDADAALTQAESELAQVDPAQADAARQRHADAARGLEQLRDVAESAARLRTALTEADARIADARKSRGPLRGGLTRAERRVSEARDALTLARKTLALSQAVSALSEHRARLVEGEPCAVCGATEHPGIDPSLMTPSQSQAQVDAREADLAAADERADTARLELTRVETILKSEARTRAHLQTEDVALRDRWSMLRMQVGGAVPDAPDDPAALPRIKAQLAQARAARDAASKQVDAAKAFTRRRDAATQARRHADAAVARAQQTTDLAAERLRSAQDALSAQRAADAAAAAAQSQADGEISALIEHVGRARFAADPSGVLTRLQAQVDAQLAARASLDAAQTSLAESEPGWAKAHADVEAQRAQLSRLRAQGDTSVARVEGLLVKREAVLGGRPVDVVLKGLAAAVRSAEADVEGARAAATSAERAAVHAQAEARAAAEALGEAQAASAEAHARLARACAEADIDVQTVATLTRHDAAWIQAEGERLSALTAAVSRADAVLRERAADLAAHAPLSDAPDSLEDARAALRVATDHRRAFERAQTTAEAALVQDDAAHRARAEAAADRVEAEEERTLWGQLDLLIGSADGAAFREFAQSLTLDAVLARANHHLQTLARRYALMRVPGENLALQVIDRHMGDEVRTVKSLSGGETFLVSLSLALGLASLSARDTRIESLFIDEGFGTLDTDTLDVVLDALDALQAGGRQIGLISHVPGLAQRIGVQVKVEPTTSGQSAVSVLAGWPSAGVG